VSATGEPSHEAPGCCGNDGLEVTCEPERRQVHREDVRDYYGKAAEAPQEALCCPTAYDPAELDHIPEEVLAISYGCGSPMAAAAPRPGETVMDLGAGGGIDCFIAARHVGPEGAVIGVDMTDPMLERATASAGAVAERLGYSVVSFRKGFLEAVPVEDGVADLVTSNCVLNLSTDKPKVFREIHRVLKNGGRFVIADIVAEQPVPERLRADPALWGECIAGAMTEREFAAAAEAAGFFAITLERDYLWKEVEGIRFYSTTFRGYRYDKAPACLYQGQTAVYLGPGRAFTDDDGHTYLRGEVVEVCSDTAAKLQCVPYRGMFQVSDPRGTPERCC
jgi:arsenite methyltransferase